MSETFTRAIPKIDWPQDCLVVVPVYNHDRTVGIVARQVLAMGAPLLVVDDGSSDKSGYAAQRSGATVVTHEVNKGKAEALRTGFQWAEEHGYKRVLTCDADGQHPIGEFPKLIAASNDKPEAIVIGRRDMRRAPRMNNFGRFMSNGSAWAACGCWAGDTQSGLRIYPIPGTNQLPCKAGRYAFEVEVLVRAVWAGIPVRYVQVAVVYPEDRVTHFHRGHDNFKTIMRMTQLILMQFIPWRKIRK